MDFKSRKLTNRDIRIFIFNIDRKYSLEQLLKQILKNNLIIKNNKNCTRAQFLITNILKREECFEKWKEEKRNTNFDKLKKYVSTVHNKSFFPQKLSR